MTMAVCPPGSLDSEFLQNLAEEISYVIEDSKLALCATTVAS